MEPLAIKIQISDRIYPMKVQPQDETFVRTASKNLAERIRTYQKKLGIEDQQDLLAMVAFDCLVAYLKVEASEKNDQLMQKISIWHDCIEKTLSQPS